MEPVILATAADVGEAAAGVVLESASARTTGRFVLGCPGGRSIVPVIDALCRRVRDDLLDLSEWTIVMMDDYVELSADGTPQSIAANQPHSCRRFGTEEIVGRLNDAAVADHRIHPESMLIPTPRTADSYDDRLSALGGIDVFLLASGASDGHVAFNRPGTPRTQRTHILPLPETTRHDNLATFPTFGGDLDEVPTHGVSVGVGTIAEQSREAVMVIFGADKVEAARRIAAADRYDPQWPSTIITECRRPHFFIDDAAAVGLR